jgi:hypothetical protein
MKTKRDWAPQYVAVMRWVPPEGITIKAVVGRRSGNVFAILKCGPWLTVEHIESAVSFTVGMQLDDASMELLIAQEEPLPVKSLDLAGQTFETNVAGMGGPR